MLYNLIISFDVTRRERKSQERDRENKTVLIKIRPAFA